MTDDTEVLRLLAEHLERDREEVAARQPQEMLNAEGERRRFAAWFGRTDEYLAYRNTLSPTHPWRANGDALWQPIQRP